MRARIHTYRPYKQYRPYRPYRSYRPYMHTYIQTDRPYIYTYVHSYIYTDRQTDRPYIHTDHAYKPHIYAHARSRAIILEPCIRTCDCTQLLEREKLC